VRYVFHPLMFLLATYNNYIIACVERKGKRKHYRPMDIVCEFWEIPLTTTAAAVEF
jgi:hypothetical protein